MFERILDKCPNCEENNIPFILYDNMGISCGYVCDECIEDRKNEYDPCIFKKDTKGYRQKVAECGEEFEPEIENDDCN